MSDNQFSLWTYIIGVLIGGFITGFVFVQSFSDCEIVEKKDLIKIGYARFNTTTGAFEITDAKLKEVILK